MPSAFVTSVEEEMRRNPELKEDDLQHLRDWNNKQPHLPTIPDDQLILFLHSCYWSLERAKKTIDACFTIRTHSPEFFSRRDPLLPEVQSMWEVIIQGRVNSTMSPPPVLRANLRSTALVPRRYPDSFFIDAVLYMEGEEGYQTKPYDIERTMPRFHLNRDTIPLPERDLAGNKVVLCRLGITDPSKFIHADGVKVFLLAMDAVLADGTQPGFRFIYDVRGLTLGHLYRVNMAVLRKYMVYVQEGLRLRMKSIDVINHSPLIDKFMALVLPLMKQEMVQQMKFHSTMETLYKVVPQRILPSDYGGQAGSLSSLKEALKKHMEANRNWYLENEKLLVDDSKRRGSTVNAADLFGMEGSFKKLDLD